MKKRIGTKIYDTDKGISVLPELNLFRQPLGKSFYLFDGKTITPIEYAEAEKTIIESGNKDAIALLHRKPNYKGDSHIAISATAADHLSAYCRQNNVTQKKVIEDYIETLEVKEQ